MQEGDELKEALELINGKTQNAEQQDRPVCLTPFSEWISWICYAVGAGGVCGFFGALFFLEGTVTASQYKYLNKFFFKD